jgi:hypothetical protein
MGVDIEYYSGLQKTDRRYNEDEDEYEETDDAGLVHFDKQPDCSDDIYRGLDEKYYYTYEFSSGDQLGSATFYSMFRRELANLAGYEYHSVDGSTEISSLNGSALPADHRLPFSECIFASDVDGTIGPVACAKLFKDFKKFASKVSRYRPLELDTESFMTRYFILFRIFAVAENNGAVVFC